jgi:hypothetical protein
MDDLEEFWVHFIRIARYQGTGPAGPKYGVEEVRKGFYDDTRKMVRNANGVEVVSTARVFLPADTAAIPPLSRITAPEAFSGRVSKVISVAVRDGAELDLPDHIEVVLE